MDPFFAQFTVDIRVVDKLIREKNAPVSEPFAGLKYHVDGFVHAVTKAEMLGEVEKKTPQFPHPACFTERRESGGRLVPVMVLETLSKLAQFPDHFIVHFPILLN